MTARLTTTLNSVRSRATRLDGTAQDYDALMELAAGSRVRPAGEATHGTHEF